MVSSAISGQVVIWGASGHALVVADIVRLRGGTVVGFIDDVDPSRAGALFADALILGGRDQLPRLRDSGVEALVMGFGNCYARLACAEVALAHRFHLPVAIHPHAVVAPTAQVGAGSLVAAGVVIAPEARVGVNVILNTASSIDHECEIGDGAHVGPGCHLAGRVRIGRACWLGIGSTVSDRVSIGEGSMIGAGSLVLEDVPPGVLAYGAPARVVRRIQ
jgi:UDP-N-acetylbacillosamine N-acetyltransferase